MPDITSELRAQLVIERDISIGHLLTAFQLVLDAYSRLGDALADNQVTPSEYRSIDQTLLDSLVNLLTHGRSMETQLRNVNEFDDDSPSVQAFVKCLAEIESLVNASQRPQ